MFHKLQAKSLLRIVLKDVLLCFCYSPSNQYSQRSVKYFDVEGTLPTAAYQQAKRSSLVQEYLST